MLATFLQRHDVLGFHHTRQSLRQAWRPRCWAQQCLEEEDGAYSVQRARNSAELRSAASLRAITFSAASKQDRSQLAALSHQRMRAQEMWEYLESATSFQTINEQDAVLICFLATTADVLGNSLAAATRPETDLSCSLPMGDGQATRIVIGTLDLSIGPRLQGDSFAGSLPLMWEEALRGRGYLSNVCVAAKARRMVRELTQGVAAAMIREAQQHAHRLGVEHLYVHCDLDNPNAQQLYEHAGYQFEQYEDAARARSLNRSRRMLLHKCIADERLHSVGRVH